MGAPSGTWRRPGICEPNGASMGGKKWGGREGPNVSVADTNP